MESAAAKSVAIMRTNYRTARFLALGTVPVDTIVTGWVVRPGTVAPIVACPAARGVTKTSIFVYPCGIVAGGGAGTIAGALEVNVTVVGTRYGDPISSVSFACLPAGTTGCTTVSAASSLRIVTVQVVTPRFASSFVSAAISRITKDLSASGTVLPRICAVTTADVSPALKNGPYPLS